MLTSDLARLSPAAARGLMRAARPPTGTPGGGARAHRRVLRGRGRRRDRGSARCSRARPRSPIARCSTRSGSSGTSCRARRRLVAEADATRRGRSGARRGRGASRRGRRGGRFGRPLDAGVPGVARRRRARPGHRGGRAAKPDAVSVLTAHGAVGHELDTVVVVGAVEGNFPSLSRPEPMFDLAALERPRTPLRAQPRAPRRRAPAVPDGARPRACQRVVLARRAEGETDGIGRRRRGSPTSSASRGHRSPRGRSTSRSRSRGDRHVAPDARRPGRAAALRVWRRSRGCSRSASTPRAGGSSATGPTRREPLHETLRLSYSSSPPRELRAAVRARRRARARRPAAATRPGSGKPIHSIIEDCENGERRRATPEAFVGRGRRALAPAGVPLVRPSPRRGARLRQDRCCRTGSSATRELRATATERGFAFDFDGADRAASSTGSDPSARGRHPITDYKTGKLRQRGARPPRACSSASTTSPSTRRRPRGVPAGDGRRARVPQGRQARQHELDAVAWSVSDEGEEEYQAADARPALRADRRELRRWRKRALPRRTPARTAASATSRRSARCTRRAAPSFPARDGREHDGAARTRRRSSRDRRREPTRGAVAADLVPARAVRARRRRGLGQDLGDGGSRRLPGAGRPGGSAEPTHPGVCPATSCASRSRTRPPRTCSMRVRRALATLSSTKARSPRS